MTEPHEGNGGIRRWLHRALADRAALYSLANTARSAVCGPITAYFIATQFSKDMQGYYYTFSSLLALQVFAELGLGNVIIQFASHEWAHLAWREGRIEGPEPARSRLASLLRFALRWYAVAAVAVLVPLGGFGLRFFAASHVEPVAWRGPWLVLCAVSAARLLTTPLFALLDGCGQIVASYGFRLLDGILIVAATWAALLGGLELWAAPLAAGVSMVAAVLFIGVRFGNFFGDLWRQPVRQRIDWKEEVLPMQWRIALSWLAGYFIFQLFTPVLFRYRGPQEAGQFGLTWNMVYAINTVGAAFIQTKVPLFGGLIAKRSFAELDRRAWQALGQSVAATLVGALALLGVVAVLPRFAPSLAERCLDLGPTAVLLVATVLMQFSSVQSSYLRAFKREPYLGLSLAFGAAVGALTWWLARQAGAAGVVWGYLGAVVLLVLPWGTWIFVQRRREWHANPPA